jgi:hypothetical protein
MNPRILSELAKNYRIIAIVTKIAEKIERLKKE